MKTTKTAIRRNQLEARGRESKLGDIIKAVLLKMRIKKTMDYLEMMIKRTLLMSNLWLTSNKALE